LSDGPEMGVVQARQVCFCLGDRFRGEDLFTGSEAFLLCIVARFRGIGLGDFWGGSVCARRRLYVEADEDERR
jgi:hypothetical protein